MFSPEIFWSSGAGAFAAFGVFALGWPISQKEDIFSKIAASWISGLCVIYCGGFLSQIMGIPISFLSVLIIGMCVSAVVGAIRISFFSNQLQDNQREHFSLIILS